MEDNEELKQDSAPSEAGTTSGVPPTESNGDAAPAECASCENYKTGWQRALADYQNLKRETDAKRIEWVQDAQVRALYSFLPIYENMRKAFTHIPQGESSGAWTAWASGCTQILKQFDDVLKQMNVEPIKTIGEQFDPRLHEALAEKDCGKPSGEILEEAEAGFKSGERIIKPAKVIINK